MFIAQSDNVDSKCPVLRATGVSESEKRGCYIVFVNRATNMETFLNIQSRVVERMNEDGKLYGSVHRVTKAFNVKLTDEALETVLKLIISCTCTYLCYNHNCSYMFSNHKLPYMQRTIDSLINFTHVNNQDVLLFN